MVARVVGEYLAAQQGIVEMYVDFGGGDAFVAEHLLYGTQVGASFEQVGGKTVAQGVGADVFLNAAGLAPVP